jgi:hypothetical protein
MDGASSSAVDAALTGIERWGASDDGRVCAGCRYLEGRVWFSAEGPRPPLHDGCRCVRRRVDVEALHGAALMRVIVEAFRNGGNADALAADARDRRRQEIGRQKALSRGSEVARRQQRRADVRRWRREVRRSAREERG